MAKTKAEAVVVLQDNASRIALFGGSCQNRVIRTESVLEDGRTRKKILEELRAEGYIEKVGEEWRQTDMAFNTLPMEETDVTEFYKFDRHDAEKGGCDYVVWDKLNPAKKKWVIQSLATGCPDFTLMVVDERMNPVKKEVFGLGKASEAIERIGGWSSARIVVTSKALREKHRREWRESYKQECLASGLNWWLHQTKVIEAEEEIPIIEKQPLFGGHPSLDREPIRWEASLLDVIERTKEGIAKAKTRLAVLEKLQLAVDQAGGWETFLTAYAAAVEDYVEKNFKLPRQGPTSK